MEPEYTFQINYVPDSFPYDYNPDTPYVGERRKPTGKEKAKRKAKRKMAKKSQKRNRK